MSRLVVTPLSARLVGKRNTMKTVKTRLAVARKAYERSGAGVHDKPKTAKARHNRRKTKQEGFSNE